MNWILQKREMSRESEEKYRHESYTCSRSEESKPRLLLYGRKEREDLGGALRQIGCEMIDLSTPEQKLDRYGQRPIPKKRGVRRARSFDANYGNTLKSSRILVVLLAGMRGRWSNDTT